jgi:DNA recombination protein RmuC
MSELTIVVALLAAAAVVLLVLLLARSARQEQALREQLGQVSVALAQAQKESALQVSGQLGPVFEGFQRSIADLGARLQGGQASTGESLRQGLEEARRTLQSQLEGLVGAVNTQLAQSQKNLGEQFQGATQVFGELKGQLGHVAEMATRMEKLGREIDELQGILKAPKLRGLLGEASLEEFLRQVLPQGCYEMQYRFADGLAVDAVIRLREHIVPIDAKFPLESFQRLQATSEEGARKSARREFERSVKARIDEIASKYIRPGEGTFDFALMFVPAEAVYYEVIIRDEGTADSGGLLAYATALRVVPVSPNSFYAYLATILTGLKGMQVEARAREIQLELGRLQQELAHFGEVFRLVGKHVGDAHRKFEEAERLGGRLTDRVAALTGGETAAVEAGERGALPRSPG